MSQVVQCQQCGASHRPVRGQTRFSCEWCGAENTAPGGAVLEELIVVGACEPSLATMRAKETLQRRGVRGARVTARPMRWSPLWQVLSDAGDEFVRSGNLETSRLEASMRMPTARLVSAEEGDPVSRAHPRPDPSVALEEIIRAARATFDDGDAPLTAVRLVWIPICDLELTVCGVRAQGLYVGGSDEVLFESLPPEATDPPARPDRLLAFAGFMAVAGSIGMMVNDPLARAFALAGWLACAWTVWGTRVFAARRRIR